jgi:hypothetical protein
MVPGVCDLERQQEERKREQQDPRDVADSVVEADELLSPCDSLLEPPLRHEGRDDQQAPERDHKDCPEAAHGKLVLAGARCRAKVVQLGVPDPVQKM